MVKGLTNEQRKALCKIVDGRVDKLSRDITERVRKSRDERSATLRAQILSIPKVAKLLDDGTMNLSVTYPHVYHGSNETDDVRKAGDDLRAYIWTTDADSDIVVKKIDELNKFLEVAS